MAKQAYIGVEKLTTTAVDLADVDSLQEFWVGRYDPYGNAPKWNSQSGVYEFSGNSVYAQDFYREINDGRLQVESNTIYFIPDSYPQYFVKVIYINYQQSLQPDEFIAYKTENKGVARKVKKGYVGVENFTPRTLPSGYTQIEYIQSSGTQYIDTGFKPNQNTKMILKMAMLADLTSKNATGVRNSSSDATNRFGIVVYTAKGKFGGFFGTDGISGPTADTNVHVHELGPDGYIVDGVSYGTMSSTTFSISYNLPLLSWSNGSNGNDPITGRLYSCQLYSGETLARDFIPCKNSSGVIGLYDLVNAVFYQNAGTGTFTAGSTHASLARKIKKAYVGIGGVARPCWAGGELGYYGTIEGLSASRQSLAATTVGDYALFGGGAANSYSTVVDAYNTSLTRSTPTVLSTGRQSLAATTVGDYALFGGGYNNVGYSTVVDAYNTSLTRSTPTALSATGRQSLAATTVGDYALFGGGTDGVVFSTVDAYNTSLTRSTPTVLSTGRYNLAATTVGDYALFGGGHTGSVYSSVVDAYNTSLTRSTPTVLSTGRQSLAATTVGDYALFGGGYTASRSAVVDAYNTSLTRSTPAALSTARDYLAATTVGDYALFGGGAANSVDAYNTSLTRSAPTALSTRRSHLAATTIGDYALFGGGYTGSAHSSVVDAYIYS